MHIGILTSGGDCPGLNAAIRGVCRAGRESFGMDITGFRDGFRGLVLDRTLELDDASLSGILTDGGTILGTSRDKPHAMPVGGKVQDMTSAAVETYHRHRLDALVCIGGGGTQKNALRLKEPSSFLGYDSHDADGRFPRQQSIPSVLSYDAPILSHPRVA